MNKLGKLTALLTASVAFCGLVGLTACSPSDDEAGEHEHNWTVSSTVAATCGERGYTVYSCDCGETKKEIGAAATGNHKFTDHVCGDCGYIDMSEMTQDEAIAEYGFYHSDVDKSSTYTTNDKVYFGVYPQELVGTFVSDNDDETAIPKFTPTAEEQELIDSLNALHGGLPDEDDLGNWTSYGYYNSGAKSDYMFYQDVTLGGEQYRGVYLTAYRPTDSTYEAAEAANSYTDEQGYELNEVYWFKYTPLEWIVLDFIGGELLLNCNYCVEAQTYNDTYTVTADKSYVHTENTSVLICDWEKSTLRTFLNSTFTDLAFTEDELALISDTKLDNATTGFTVDSPYQTMQKPTTDKVFLLSAQDMMNTAYGFPATIDYDSVIDRGGTDPDDASVSESLPRRRHFTAYALIQGMRPSSVAHTAEGEPTCWYTLRSSGNNSYSICGITKYGSVQYKGASGNPAYSVNAIVPSLNLKIK